MTAIERTAYPRFKQSFTQAELDEFYTLTEGETAFVLANAAGRRQQLALAILLKGFQKLGYLPQMGDIPDPVKRHIAGQLSTTWDNKKLPDSTRKRYRRAIQTYLDVQSYGQDGAQVVTEIVRQSAQTMSDPADLINVAIEQLVRHRFELPAYQTLDRLVNHLRHQVHLTLYAQVTEQLTAEQKEMLDGLLVRGEQETRHAFTRLKLLPARASLRWVRQWAEHLEWLEKILNPQPFLAGLTSTKIEQFAAQAYQMEISDIRGVKTDAKRYTLLLCLLHRMQVRTRDQLVTMYLKRVRRLHRQAKERLAEIQEQQQVLSETMISAFADVVQQTDETEKLAEAERDAALGQQVRRIVQANGGTEKLQADCELLLAYQNDNYLPLLPRFYRSQRATLFRLTQRLSIRAATQNRELIAALAFIQENRPGRGSHLPADVSLGFASLRWQNWVQEKVDGELRLNRHRLEICVFTHLSDGLRSGDLFVEGTETYADYRSQLLAWSECQSLLEGYCQAVGLATSAADCVQTLRQRFIELAKRVDVAQSEESDLYFDAVGKPHLRQLERLPAPEKAAELEKIMLSRLPERHLLELLANVQHWVQYTRHFGPPSGADPKLKEPLARYLLTVFGYGCNLGPAQTARHARRLASERVIGRINAQHITTDKLDAAIRDVINEYARFRLPFIWGSGKAAIADGTHYELYENNLLGEQHIRYGGYGGIAYHHISDTYVALFSRFIACGVWEAVYILDGLLANQSVLQPDTVHADTHGQSEVVFGLAHLLGIQLMPRMRNWNKVTMYRPDKTTPFEHIGTWFGHSVNWALIEEQWQDLMQVVLSIHKGKVLPSWLLQKLNTDNPKNKLYLAFRELGCVIRSMFLLEYVSNAPLRREIRAATTKIEAYHSFSDWIGFGGDSVLKSRDPVEYEKRIKYKDLIANAIMLQNVVDMTEVLHAMAQEGHEVTLDVIATFSPYLVEHIKRFGEYVIDTETVPPPLQPDKFFLPVAA